MTKLNPLGWAVLSLGLAFAIGAAVALFFVSLGLVGDALLRLIGV